MWIGGTYGTDVASVDLVATDGTTVPATVASGTLVPGHTMFWGSVDGDLAMAVTRDAAGDVLERARAQGLLDAGRVRGALSPACRSRACDPTAYGYRCGVATSPGPGGPR